jgi:hypothetical protein
MVLAVREQVDLLESSRADGGTAAIAGVCGCWRKQRSFFLPLKEPFTLFSRASWRHSRGVETLRYAMEQRGASICALRRDRIERARSSPLCRPKGELGDYGQPVVVSSDQRSECSKRMKPCLSPKSRLLPLQCCFSTSSAGAQSAREYFTVPTQGGRILAARGVAPYLEAQPHHASFRRFKSAARICSALVRGTGAGGGAMDC